MSSSGGKTTQVSKQELAPEQQRLLGLVMPKAEEYINTPLQQYPGERVAGFTPTQEQGRAAISQAALGQVAPAAQAGLGTAVNTTTGGVDAATQAGGVLANAGATGASNIWRPINEMIGTQGSRDFLSGGALLDPRSNPVLAAQSEAAIRPLERSLMENILPRIDEQFVGDNMFNSSRRGIAQGQAVDGFLQQAGDIVTNLQANNFNQGLGAMLETSLDAARGGRDMIGQGIGATGAAGDLYSNLALQSMSMLPQLSQLAFVPGMTLEGLGAQEQALNQARIDDAAERFTTEQMLPFMQAQDVANLAFGIGGGSTTTTGQQNPASSPIQQGLGMAMMLPMLFGLSDRKAKKDIALIGTTSDGVNIYEWTYKHSGERAYGVIADEVPYAIAGTMELDGEELAIVDYASI